MNILEPPSSNGHTSGRVQTLTIDPKPGRKKLPWRAIAASILVLAVIITGVLIYRGNAAGSIAYVTTPVAQQDLVQTVTATGTVNPQNTIDVGTQVSGTISEIDVDYNSTVKKGQVLARIDPTALKAALGSAQAQLAQSQAVAAAAQTAATSSAIGIQTAKANAIAAAATARASQATALSNEQAIAAADSGIGKAQSAEQVAQLTVSRDDTLLAQGYVAQATVDNDKSNLVAAQSAVQSAVIAAQQARSEAAASAAQAQASAAQTASLGDTAQAAGSVAAGSADTAQANLAAIGIQEAAVEQAQTNLKNSVITSPVDGTVIARDVSVGTTVAASLQTPTLFAIAQNLDKMEVDLAVGEPDIGSVKDGENVNFTVLAYPSRTFHGVISQVRKDPVTTSNVVTYDTVVLVNNDDGALLPGMTANATIAVQTAPNALVVPLSALTFTPDFGAAGTHHRTAGTAGTHAAGTHSAAVPGTAVAASGNAAAPWGNTLGSAATAVTAGSNGRVFVERAGKLVRVPVSIALVSGTQAAVTPLGAATLAAGDQVVTGDGSAVASVHKQTTTANPFTGGGGPGAMRGIH